MASRSVLTHPTDPDGRQFHRWAIGSILSLWALLSAACGWMASTPEARAQEYLEALVQDPENNEALKAIANNPSAPEALVQGLEARVALDYLCARRKQGASLYFAHSDVRRLGPKRREVVVLASQDYGGVSGKEVGFQISLEKDEALNWRIIRVSAWD